MSRVANVLVQADREDTDLIVELSEWLRNDCPWESLPSNTGVGFLECITEHTTTWGGWKYPECNLWAGALNHADLSAVRQKVESMAWHWPAAVQLFIQDQEEDYFRLYMIRDGRLRGYTPPPMPDETWHEHHAG